MDEKDFFRRFPHRKRTKKIFSDVSRAGNGQKRFFQAFPAPETGKKGFFRTFPTPETVKKDFFGHFPDRERTKRILWKVSGIVPAFFTCAFPLPRFSTQKLLSNRNRRQLLSR